MHREERPGRKPQPLSLKARALRHLAHREHSRAELTRKLSAHAASEAEVAAVLDDLGARGFQSDARVVDAVLHQRAGQFGIARIRQTLQAKGIAESAIHPALAALSGDEHERAWALWCKRFGRTAAQADGAPDSTSPDDAADARSADSTRGLDVRRAQARETARQARFLMSRGFSPEVVHATLRRARTEHPDDDDMTAPETTA